MDKTRRARKATSGRRCSFADLIFTGCTVICLMELVAMSARRFPLYSPGTPETPMLVRSEPSDGEKSAPPATTTALPVIRSMDRNESLSVCSHSCIQTLREVCLDENGVSVGPPATRDALAQAQGRVAIVTNFNLGQRNLQHVFYEFAFPISFYLSNCWDSRHKAVYFMHTKKVAQLPCDDPYGVLTEMIRRQVGNVTLAPPCLSLNTEKATFQSSLACFEEVKIFVNPLRSPCRIDRDFRYREDAFKIFSFRGHRGLASYFFVDGENGTEYVSREAVERSVRSIRQHLESFHLASPVSIFLPALSRETIAITIINRRDASTRVAKNGISLSTAIKKAFPGIQAPIIVREMSKLSYKEQLGLFDNSAVVIAVHGAALANAIAMRPGSLLIAHCIHDTCESWDFPVPRIVGVICEQISCEDPDQKLSSSGWKRLPSVDYNIEAVLMILDKYLGERKSDS